MLSWYRNYQVDISICGEVAGSIKEIEHTDEIKFGIVFLECFFHPAPFFFIIFSKLNVMFTVNIHNMQVWFKNVQDLFDLRNRCG